MLTKFAAALLATSLIAGSAIAAQPSGTPAANGAAPAVQTKTPSDAGGQHGQTRQDGEARCSPPQSCA